MKKWILLVVPTVVLLALVVADQAAKGWAETKLAERAAAYYASGAGSSASIRSFPFVGRLVLAGAIPRVDVNLEDLRLEAVMVRRLSIRVADVRIDRGELFGGRVHVDDIGQARMVATVDGPSLARAAGADVRFTPGEVTIHRRIRGVDVSATGRLTIKGNVVTITPTSVEGLAVPPSTLTITYRLPGIELLPCQADVEIVRNAVVLSCDVVDIPAALVQAAQPGR